MCLKRIKIELKLISDCYEFISWKIGQNHRKNRYRLKVRRLGFFGYKNKLKEICISIPDDIKKLEKSTMHGVIEKEKNYIGKNQIKISLIDFVYSLFLAAMLYTKNKEKNYILLMNITINVLSVRRFKISGVEKITLFGYAYDLDMVAIAYIAKRKKIFSRYVVDTGFLDFCGPVLADEVIYRTMYQCEYHRLYYSRECKVLNQYKLDVKDTGKRNVIGVYTSGFSQRGLTESKSSYLRDGRESEKKMIIDCAELAKANPKVEFRLYIHRNGSIETDSTANYDYNELIQLKNVLLMTSNRNSKEEFPEVDVAITCVSEIFFDRLECGRPAILSHCFEDKFIKAVSLEKFNSKNYNSLEYLVFNEDLAIQECS